MSSKIIFFSKIILKDTNTANLLIVISSEVYKILYKTITVKNLNPRTAHLNSIHL